MVIILVLAVVYGVRFLNFDSFVIPTNSLIADQKQKIKQLHAEIANLEKLKEKRKEKREKIEALVRDFWFKKGKLPTNQIQNTVERLGKRSGLPLSKVGAPKPVEISENLRAVDITVSSTTSIEMLSKFLREIENHDPVLTWDTCIIRPNRTKEPTAVNISGKIRAYVAEEIVTDYIEGESL